MKFNYERELYPIVKAYLEAEGYAVKSEVKDCDIMAATDDVSVIVELKLSFNLKLVFQVLHRLEQCPNVFIAIPEYAFDNRAKRKRDIVKLMRALGVGIMLIGRRPSGDAVDVVVQPPLVGTAVDRALREEFQSRSFDLNSGGMVRQKIVTAFREQVIEIAAFLACNGTTKVAQIKAETGIERAAAMLQRNHYGWFVRVARGHYNLADQFYIDIKQYRRLYDFYLQKYR